MKVLVEEHKVFIIRHNLLQAYQDRLALVDTTTRYQLNIACNRIEQSQYSSIRRPQFLLASVNYVQPRLEQRPKYEYKSQTVNQSDGSNVRCFNCNKQGHNFNDCPLPRKKP